MLFDFKEDTAISPAHIGMGGAQVLEFRAKLNRTQLNINRDTRTVDNVTIAQLQEARGHGVEIEMSFLTDMQAYVEKKMGGRVQCNMGHRYNSLGFQFGYFTDHTIDGKQFKAKLTVYKAADKAPEMKGMGEWFFDLIEEDEKAVMCSIKFEPLHYYQYDDKGQKVIIKYFWYSGPEKAFQNKPAYVAFKRLISCDIVDEGALTDSLFSDQNQSAGLMLQEIMNAPGFIEWYKVNHQHFPQLTSFYQEQMRFSFSKLFQNIFSNPNKMEEGKNTPPVTTSAAEGTPATPAASTAPATPPVDMNTLQAQITAMQTELQTLKQTNASQAAEITALKASPGAEHSGVKDESPGRIDTNKAFSYEDDPINKKVKAFQRSK